jgi:hypothetical protein
VCREGSHHNGEGISVDIGGTLRQRYAERLLETLTETFATP